MSGYNKEVIETHLISYRLQTQSHLRDKGKFLQNVYDGSLFQTYHITLELGHKAEILAHIWDNPSHIVAEQESTHQWECWVNAKVGNMSKYVDKVVFNLHETFPKPKRGKYTYQTLIP